jgi:hypothetical protein
MTALHVLDEGEDPYGDTVKDATGHIVMSLLTFAAEAPAFAGRLGAEERDAVRRLLDRRGATAVAPDRHTALYPGYLERIAPADRDLILPSLIDALTLAGTPDDLRTRIATLEEAGIDEIVIHPVLDPPAEMAELAKLTSSTGPGGETRAVDNLT